MFFNNNNKNNENMKNNNRSNIQYGAEMDSEDIHKWESDPTPFFDKIYHNLLGETVNEEGVWERDPKRTRLMNEKGASQYINQLMLRFSINSQNGELDDNQIKRIIKDSSEVYAEQLADYYDEWDIDPKVSNFYSIALGFTHALEELLSVMRNGGFKKHKEHRKGYRETPVTPEMAY